MTGDGPSLVLEPQSEVQVATEVDTWLICTEREPKIEGRCKEEPKADHLHRRFATDNLAAHSARY